MSYSIRYSAEARQDIRDIYEYIAFELLAPDIAVEQYRRIVKAIRKLDDMPLRFPLYKDEPWKSLGLRWLPVGNYLIFYSADESVEEIAIVRIMYKGRDISKVLNEEKCD